MCKSRLLCEHLEVMQPPLFCIWHFYWHFLKGNDTKSVGTEYQTIDPRSINLSIPTDHSIFSLQAPYFVGGNEIGLTCGLMVALCSIMINNAVTWRMTSIWGLTASTFATPLLVKVIVTVAQCYHWLKLQLLTSCCEYFWMHRLWLFCCFASQNWTRQMGRRVMPCSR